MAETLGTLKLGGVEENIYLNSEQNMKPIVKPQTCFERGVK